MSDFLAEMASSSRRRADETRARSGEALLMSRATSARPAIPLSLSREGFDLIAEAKLASPADGQLVASDDSEASVSRLATAYSAAGAVAISVLTTPERFGGSLTHLERASRAVEAPVLRKDFLVDRIQVIEARAAGASGVLLIARLVSGELLEEMVDLATSLAMFALVEVFDEYDIEAASIVFDRDILIGVNTRDLSNLQVDPSRLTRLAHVLPEGIPAVAESGIKTPDDAAEAARLGYRLALVGTSLVTSESPENSARRLIAAGRSAIQAGASR